MRLLNLFAGSTLALSTLALLGGCSIVDDAHLETLRNQADSGSIDSGADTGTPVDAGPVIALADRCGAATAPVFAISTDGQIAVDTRENTNQVGSCGSRSAPGHEGFIAIDVVGGDMWHFHVVPDPSVADQVRDPFLYLLTDGCDSRDCDHSSDSCVGGGDEHFAFVAPNDGRFFLGIDDRNEGGGQYLIQAVKLNCGDGSKAHGEGCDGSATCDTQCHEIISETRPTEQLPNDNEIEANFIEFPASNTITIGGAIGGDLCTYPDVYQFRVTNPGSTLDVVIVKDDGTACDSATLTPFDIVLRGTDGDVRRLGEPNAGTSCSELHVTGLEAATFLLYLEHSTPIEDRQQPYRLRLSLTL